MCLTRTASDLREPGDGTLGTTADELPGVLDWLAADPERGPHLEVGSSSKSSTGQAMREYQWTVRLLRERGLA